VIAKRMFGFRALYRGKKIFAALPHSRGFGPEASILLKFDPMPPALSQRAKATPASTAIRQAKDGSRLH